MKKKQQNLILQMGFLYLIVILLLGLILISEKRKEVIIPQVEKKLKEYINENYQNKNIKENKITYNKQKEIYTIKIENKQNNDLYFFVKYDYKTKKITSTYKKDYIEGKSLTTNIEKSLNKKLVEKQKKLPSTFKNVRITYKTKLSESTKSIKEELLNKNYTLPLYTINLEDNISKLTEEILLKKLKTINNYFKNINIVPKDYNIILNNKTTPTKSININIDQETLNNNLETICNLIINNKQIELEQYNIKYKYLN